MDSTPLVLISGVITTSAIWDLVRPLLPSPLFCFAPTSKNTIREEALNLHEHLLKLGISHCHLIGHSMGGAIALEYALLYPKRVKSLTLCNSFAKLQRSERLLARLNLIASLFHLPQKWIVKQSMSRLFSPTASTYIKQLYLNMTEETSREALQRQLSACLAFDREKDLPHLKVPTQVIVTQVDRLVSPTHSRVISQLIPHAQLLTLPGEGHIPPLEYPQAFTAAARGPLSQTPSR